jgi:hypothetical protein
MSDRYEVQYYGTQWTVKNADGTRTGFGPGEEGRKKAEKHANMMNRNAAK